MPLPFWLRALAAAVLDAADVRPSRKTLLAAVAALLLVCFGFLATMVSFESIRDGGVARSADVESRRQRAPRFLPDQPRGLIRMRIRTVRTMRAIALPLSRKLRGTRSPEIDISAIDS